MQNPLKKLNDFRKIRDQAIQIQKKLSNEILEVNKNGVRIIISGDQKIKTLEIDGQPNFRVQEAVNEAIEKSQKAAAQKLQQMSGSLSGLLGE